MTDSCHINDFTFQIQNVDIQIVSKHSKTSTDMMSYRL